MNRWRWTWQLCQRQSVSWVARYPVWVTKKGKIDAMIAMIVMVVVVAGVDETE